jgi:hypothetical protein
VAAGIKARSIYTDHCSIYTGGCSIYISHGCSIYNYRLRWGQRLG